MNEQAQKLAQALKAADAIATDESRTEQERAEAKADAQKLAKALRTMTQGPTPAQQAADSQPKMQEIPPDLMDWSPQPETTWVPSRRTRRSNFTGQLFNPEAGSPEFPDRKTWLDQAAQRGVDVNTGLRVSDRGRMALIGFDKDMKAAAMEQLVRTSIQSAGIELPEGAPVIFVDSTSGEPVYLRPTPEGKLKPTVINPPGLDLGDLTEFAAELPTIALETGGSIAGGFAAGAVTGPGAGVATGATAGAVVGNKVSVPVRKAIARLVGVPEDIVESAEGPWYDAVLAGATEAGAFALQGTIRAFKNRGRIITEDALPELQATFRKNLAVVDELEQRLGGKLNLSPTAGEITNDEAMLVAEAALRRQVRGSRAQEMQAQEATLRNNLSRAVRELADVDGVRLPDVSEPVESVTQRVSDIARRPIEQVEEQVANAQRHINDAADNIAETADLGVFNNVRDGAADSLRATRQAEKEAWDTFRNKALLDPETGRTGYVLDNPADSPIRQAFQSLNQQTQLSMSEAAEQASRKFMADQGYADQPVDELSRLAAKSLDLHSLHRHLSMLKRRLRSAERGVDPDGWAATDIKNVIDAIETQMAGGRIRRRTGQQIAGAEQDAVRLAWTDAKDTTLRRIQQFDTANMDMLLERQWRKGPDGRPVYEFVAPGGAIRRRMFKAGDARFLDEALEASGRDPATRAALGNELMVAYRDAVFKDGVPQRAAHNRFMTDYADHMRLVFGEEQASRVANLGTLAKQVDRLTANARQLEDAIAVAYGKRVVDPFNQANLAKEILSDRISPQQARKLMNRIESVDPELATQVRGSVFDQMFSDITTKNDLLNSQNMGTLLRTQKETLDVVFGVPYRRNLEQLHEVLKMHERRSSVRPGPTDAQPDWLAITRSVFGPLTRKQRFMTAANRLNRKLAAAKAYEIMHNPRMLEQFMVLKKLDPRSPRFYATVTALGIADAVSPETLETSRLAYERAAQTRAVIEQNPEDAVWRARYGGF